MKNPNETDTTRNKTRRRRLLRTRRYNTLSHTHCIWKKKESAFILWKSQRIPPTDDDTNMNSDGRRRFGIKNIQQPTRRDANDYHGRGSTTHCPTNRAYQKSKSAPIQWQSQRIPPPNDEAKEPDARERQHWASVSSHKKKICNEKKILLIDLKRKSPRKISWFPNRKKKSLHSTGKKIIFHRKQKRTHPNLI